MAPKSYHGRRSEFSGAPIWHVNRLESADPLSSDDTTAEPFAQSHFAQCTGLASNYFLGSPNTVTVGFPPVTSGIVSCRMTPPSPDVTATY
jgi:hypothetical protein